MLVLPAIFIHLWAATCNIATGTLTNSRMICSLRRAAVKEDTVNYDYDTKPTTGLSSEDKMVHGPAKKQAPLVVKKCPYCNSKVQTRDDYGTVEVVPEVDLGEYNIRGIEY